MTWCQQSDGQGEEDRTEVALLDGLESVLGRDPGADWFQIKLLQDVARIACVGTARVLLESRRKRVAPGESLLLPCT